MECKPKNKLFNLTDFHCLARIVNNFTFFIARGQNNACSSIKCPPNTPKYCLGGQVNISYDP